MKFYFTPLPLVFARFRHLASHEIPLLKGKLQESAGHVEKEELLDSLTQKLSHAFYASQWEALPIQSGSVVLARVENTADQAYHEDAEIAVLLTQKSSEVPHCWEGYVLMGDAAYAGEWDVVLEECDQPVGPWADAVQVWNTVLVAPEQIDRRIGQLDDARMSAIQAVVQQLLSAEELNLAAQPGTLVQRQVAGHVLRTGTPVVDGDDPRCMYQLLYRELGGAVGARALAYAHAAELATQVADVPEPDKGGIVSNVRRKLSDILAELSASLRRPARFGLLSGDAEQAAAYEVWVEEEWDSETQSIEFGLSPRMCATLQAVELRMKAGDPPPHQITLDRDPYTGRVRGFVLQLPGADDIEVAALAFNWYPERNILTVLLS